MFYTVCYNEGTCGSFIASLLVLMLTETSSHLHFTSNGACDKIYAEYAKSKLDLSDFKNHNDVFKIKPLDTNSDNFTIWKGVEANVNCEQANMYQSNWHQLVITHEIEELLAIRLLHWYKGDRFYYQRFYKNNLDRVSFKVEDIRNLKFEETIEFLKEFISLMLSDEFAKFDQNVPSKWGHYYNSLDNKCKEKFTTIKFADILGNPELVLATLSNMTGKSITEHVRFNYNQYLIMQQKSFKNIFGTTDLAPAVKLL